LQNKAAPAAAPQVTPQVTPQVAAAVENDVLKQIAALEAESAKLGAGQFADKIRKVNAEKIKQLKKLVAAQ
jgi:hypothetical protein